MLVCGAEAHGLAPNLAELCNVGLDYLKGLSQLKGFCNYIRESFICFLTDFAFCLILDCFYLGFFGVWDFVCGGFFVVVSFLFYFLWVLFGFHLVFIDFCLVSTLALMSSRVHTLFF